MAATRTADLPGGATGEDLPEGFWYSVKRRLLGPPLVNEQLTEERLSRRLALGVLSCDGISSANYGSELILYILLPAFGLSAFNVLLPMTGVVLLGIVLVVLSYREVVSVYTRAGGSYVVARENFGPRVAQVAAVALMVDYVVTVAVQTAAGSAAVLSTFPVLSKPLGDKTTLLIIAVTATLIMCYVNLLGIRENGKTFALPTYLFSGSVGLMIIIGVARDAFGGGLPHVHWGPHTVPVGHNTSGLLTFAAIWILAKAYANGGSSLTGIEAVSNAVSALRPPESRNARHVLIAQGSIVAFLIGGISWIAHVTHAVPYTDGVPTVVSQEASLIFGHTLGGRILFYVLQVGAAAILFTGGNTSFSGFPFLASFVAGDSFLPRWLNKRGHRLVFSNGIILLTVLAVSLLLAVGANTANLVPFYAIGVFTGFSMAGFGMVVYHLRQKERAWRWRLAVNLAGGIYTALVVLIFAIVKFTAGAWLVVVVFPIGVFAFIRLNREYRLESRVLETIGGKQPPPLPHYARRVILIFVDNFDLATLAALRYARSLRPTTMRAVHFVIDSARADQLRRDWARADRGVVLDMVDCADRRIGRATAELVSAEVAVPGTHVTVVLPRRSYSPLLGRLLHDRTADKIARVVSRIPRCAATIIPYDVESRLEMLQEREVTPGTGQPAGAVAGAAGAAGTGPDGSTSTAPASGPPPEAEPDGGWRSGIRHGGRPSDAPVRKGGTSDYARPVPPSGVTPIGSLAQHGRATVAGRVHIVEIRPAGESCVLACTVADSTGELTAMFYGRQHIPGLEPGVKIRLTGAFGIRNGVPEMINPTYELLAGPS